MSNPLTVRLTDVKTNRYETEFGTCDYCMSTGVAEEDTYVVTFSDGHTTQVDAFIWDWGDFFNVYVDNIPKFMVWVNEQKFTVDTYDEVDYAWLSEKAYEYEEASN